MDEGAYEKWKVQQYQTHEPFDFECYHTLIQDLTPKSTILALEKPVAQAIVNYYHHRFNSREVFTSEDQKHLRNFEDHTFASQQDIFPCFVRLSSRSPKDGMSLNMKPIYDDYLATYEKLLEQYPPENDNAAANLRMVAICKAQMAILKVDNPKQAMNLILTSERVFSDLLTALTASSQIGWKTNVIIRSWDSRISDSLEFRVFVKNERILCISQYNHYCVFPNLLELYGADKAAHQDLKQAMKSFWELVHGRLISAEQFSENYKAGYIVDFAVFIKEDGSFGLMVVELNPYERTTGACLYDWPEIDKLAMENVTDPELRFRTELMENQADLVNSCILPTLTRTDPPYDDFYLDEPEPAPRKRWLSFLRG